jgi:hypothetical protein
MNRFETPTINELQLDLKTWQEAVIPLEPEDYDRATQLSQPLPTESRQWKTYLNGLALYGMVQWLGDRIDQSIDLEHCSVLQPQYANVLDAVAHLHIGEFKLCLLTTESIADEAVSISRIVVDLPEFIAHLYVLIEVQEEQAQLILRGCLRYDQLIADLRSLELTLSPNWHYCLPLECFDSDANHLLFYLSFLDPAAICLPTATESVRIKLSQVQAELGKRLSQLHPKQELWQRLTWEQATALLSSPPLLNLLYLWQTRLEQANEIGDRFQTVLHQLTGQVMNVWHWSQLATDEINQRLAWTIPQPFLPAAATRRATEKFESILKDLQQRQTVEIPPHAYYASQNLAGTPFQLGAATWLLPATSESVPENAAAWALLLVLVAQPGSVLPHGIKLQVSMTTILTEAVLETDDLYLYILIEGSPTEEFVVSILPPNELPITLPSFVCAPSL